ncbi:MAG TPA: globin domain-containing protein [Thermohalobaculum sp.]|nr:globin domain-containing protein [Thermohalobaculum sp.]
MTKAQRILSHGEVEAVRESFATLQPRVGEASQMFYERLFAIAPELRSLFRDEIEEQGMRFMTALGAILNYIDDPVALTPHLQRLAKGHSAYGIKPEHFRPMGEALIWTMRKSLGDRLSSEAEAAWVRAYDELARRMIELAKE